MISEAISEHLISKKFRLEEHAPDSPSLACLLAYICINTHQTSTYPLQKNLGYRPGTLLCLAEVFGQL